jgi:hypothetical protein
VRLIGAETAVTDFSSPLGLLTPILTPSYQSAFQVWTVWPWEGLWLGLQAAPLLWGRVMGLKVILDVVILLFFTGLIPVTLRLQRSSYFIYVLGLYVMNLTQVMPGFPLADFPRRMMVAFPIFIVLAMLSQRRWVRLPLLFIGMTLSFILSACFVWWLWVG